MIISLWVLIEWFRSELTTIPGPLVAGPDVKTIIRAPVVTEHPWSSPNAVEIAVPVDL